MGKLEIKKALHRYAKLRQQSVASAMENTKFPKNLIIFIGDGMSISTVTAARILKNQKMENISDVDDEEQELTWENFPEMALMKVLMYMILLKNTTQIDQGFFFKVTPSELKNSILVRL